MTTDPHRRLIHPNTDPCRHAEGGVGGRHGIRHVHGSCRSMGEDGPHYECFTTCFVRSDH
jgi:hypothetical protein